MPDCHHASREPHHCHFGRCPPCRQICAKQYESCQHRCTAPCHSAIWRRQPVADVAATTRAGPWEAPPLFALEMTCLPCPACSEPVAVTCLGAHEMRSVSCSEAVSSSCGRQCQRRLTCSNHVCQLDCHTVTEALDSLSAGVECEVCELPCQKPRPAGCSHKCQHGVCHEDDCPPCRQMVRMRCHCTLVVQHIECSVWTSAGLDHRNQLQSCGSNCPKPLSCGHNCGAVCHPAPCSTDPRSCMIKVKVKCRCGRRRADRLCSDIQAGGGVECDDVCQAEKERRDKEREERERVEKEAELDKEKAELERKSQGRRRRRRREEKVEESPSLLHRVTVPVLISVLVILLSVFIYWILSTQ